MTDLVTRHRAARAVTCPRCGARPGCWCTSTGGGNFAYANTHAVRIARVQDWPSGQLQAASVLVRSLPSVRASWPEGASDALTAFDAQAAPVKPKPAGQPTPKGVRISEAQAERIEWAAQAGGRYTVSAAHFHGDAADRQSTNALEAKGILRHVGDTPDGYGRILELTDFGWQVYRQHRLIIHREVPHA